MKALSPPLWTERAAIIYFAERNLESFHIDWPERNICLCGLYNFGKSFLNGLRCSPRNPTSYQLSFVTKTIRLTKKRKQLNSQWRPGKKNLGGVKFRVYIPSQWCSDDTIQLTWHHNCIPFLSSTTSENSRFFF